MIITATSVAMRVPSDITGSITMTTRVLLVEDCWMDAELLRGLLADEPFTVFHAETLAQAMLLVDKVDLLMVDLSLSDVDIETTITHLVKECPKPVLILTGTVDTDLAYRMGRLGVLGSYLVKPTTKEQLSVSIAWAFGLYKRLTERGHRIENILKGLEDNGNAGAG